MEMIKITEKNFVGKELHKKTFEHPENPDACIKLPYSKEGEVDLMRELKYRELRMRKGMQSSLLPAYYGSVKTSLGQGFLFEYVRNYNGSACATLEDYCKNESLLKKKYKRIFELLCDFRKKLFSEQLITMGIFAENLIIQKESEKKVRIRLINDIGTGVFIPLEYHIEIFRHRRIKKRWNEFLTNLWSMYPSDVMKCLIRDLKENP